MIDADVDVNVGGGQVNGVSLLNLRGVEQSDALISLVGETKLAEVDLDATIDDQRVIIVDIDDTFSDETIAKLDVALAGGNTGGVDETQAVVSASVVLSSVLANYGLSAEDVLALQIGEQGQTFVYVRVDLENNLNVVADADVASENIADANVRLLDDGTVADANIDILPRAGDEIGEPLVDVDANISTPGEGDGQSSGLGIAANVTAAGEDAANAHVNVLEGGALAEASVNVLPNTDTQDNGVNADADVDLGDTEVADLALAVLDDALLSGDLVVLPGDDGADGDDSTSGGDDGIGGGDDGAAGGDDGAGGGDDGAAGVDDGAGGGDDGAAAGDDGTNGGVGGTPGGATPNTTTDRLMGQPGSMECPAGIRPFLEATANADALMAATEAEVVVLTGCPTDGLFQTADFSRLRTVIERLPVTKAALDTASVPAEDVVSATVSGDKATIYVIE